MSAELYALAVAGDRRILQHAIDLCTIAAARNRDVAKTRRAIEVGNLTASNVRGLKVSLGRRESKLKRELADVDEVLATARLRSALTVLSMGGALDVVRELQATLIDDAEAGGYTGTIELLERALDALNRQETRAA